MKNRSPMFDGWSCRCGMRFRSATSEAVHRHNFPALCRRPATRYTFQSEGAVIKRRVTVHSRLGEQDARERATEVLDRRYPDISPVNWGLRRLP